MAVGDYTVSHSGVVAENLRRVMFQAEAEGRRALALRAAQWAVEELERTPNEFGESREYLVHARIQLRCAFPRPIYVEFGVHEETRQVFLRRFLLLR